MHISDETLLSLERLRDVSVDQVLVGLLEADKRHFDGSAARQVHNNDFLRLNIGA